MKNIENLIDNRNVILMVVWKNEIIMFLFIYNYSSSEIVQKCLYF